MLNIPHNESGYYLKANEGNTLHLYMYTLYVFIDSTFFPGRCADVYGLGQKIGQVGVVHPDAILAFDLNLPASALEINIEPFL